MPQSELPPSHFTLPTIKPSERRLVVNVPQEAFLKNGGVLPVESTTYPACAETFFSGDYRESCSNFIYTEQYGERGMAFALKKTPKQRATPFLDYSEERDIEWPAIVQWLKFEQEYGFPLSQNYIQGGSQGIATVPRWLVQYSWIPAMSLKTIVRVKEFLSEVPYPDWAAESDEPKPTTISWDLIGSHGNLGVCLHPKVEVPGQGDNAGIRVVLTVGAAQSGNSSQRGQIFPATNHITWQDYTVNTIKRVEGQYHRVQETFVAPILPRPSLLEN